MTFHTELINTDSVNCSSSTNRPCLTEVRDMHPEHVVDATWERAMKLNSFTNRLWNLSILVNVVSRTLQVRDRLSIMVMLLRLRADVNTRFRACYLAGWLCEGIEKKISSSTKIWLKEYGFDGIFVQAAGNQSLEPAAFLRGVLLAVIGHPTWVSAETHELHHLRSDRNTMIFHDQHDKDTVLVWAVLDGR